MTTELNAGAPVSAEQAGSIGAGADIYRKLDRRPRGSKTAYAAPLIAVAIVLAGGAVAYMMLKPNAAPHSSAPPAPIAAEATTPLSPPAQPSELAATPAPAAQAPVAAPRPAAHHAQRPARVAAQTVRARPQHRAASAMTSGEDASAYRQPAAPATPVTAPPTAATQAPAAPVALPPPPAPPAAAGSAPAQPPS